MDHLSAEKTSLSFSMCKTLVCYFKTLILRLFFLLCCQTIASFGDKMNLVSDDDDDDDDMMLVEEDTITKVMEFIVIRLDMIPSHRQPWILLCVS